MKQCVVASNVKKTVKDLMDLNTSAEVIEVLNKKIHVWLEEGCQKATEDGRKTLMARDFEGLL